MRCGSQLERGACKFLHSLSGVDEDSSDEPSYSEAPRTDRW